LRDCLNAARNLGIGVYCGMMNHNPRLANLKRLLLFATALCLALAISATAPASPARAADSGECVQQAWIQPPTANELASMPDSFDWGLSSAIALNQEYAVLVWVGSSSEVGITFKATVGKVSGDSIDFTFNHIHSVRPPGGGSSRPSVAINDQGQVVIVSEMAGRLLMSQACQVTGSGGDVSLDCGSCKEMLYAGFEPSVAMNNNGWAVFTFEDGDGNHELRHLVGKFVAQDKSVRWNLDASTYGSGIYSDVAISGDLVVEVHHDKSNFTDKLYYRVGHLDESDGSLVWGESHLYETDGVFPKVALDGKVVVAMHRGSDVSHYRYGIVADDNTIEWQGGTGGHAWSSGEGNDLFPCVAASHGRVLMDVFRVTYTPPKLLYGGLGYLGYDLNCPWPGVQTESMSHISTTGAVSGGKVITPGFSSVTARGVCWSTSQNPTINDSHTSDGKGIGTFTSHLSGLAPNTGYFVRAYATNADGTGYGEPVFFMTGQGTPAAATFAPLFITAGGAEVSGAVTKKGSANVTDRGMCWSTSANPTTIDGHVSAGSGLGGFQEFVSGLEANTTYYLRAYGSNEYGTGYGANVSFVTADSSLATVYTADPQDITANSANLGGEVTGQGSGPVTERGVVWDTAPKPNLNSQRAPMGSGIGAFSGNLTGFASENTYYLRAYAINDSGASFGQEKIFTASSDALPKVITIAPYGETATTALSGGYVSNSGQSAVTARGVCWSTAPKPDLSGPHTVDGAGMGGFHSAITDLTQDIGYYLRAYATNHAGTSYGEEYFFHSTHTAAPTVQTLDYSGLDNDSVTLSGEVVTPGGGPVIARGVCWSTSPHPKVTDNLVSAGSGLGQFNATIGGLMPETAYYARAYAINEYGTAYGHILHFRTTFCPHPCR
jgi:hypothetical protein